MQNIIQEMLANSLQGQLSKALSKKVGISESNAINLVKIVMPLVLAGLAKKASNPSEAKALSNALDADHDGSILENITAAIDDSKTETIGTKIMKHVFGDQQASAIESVAKTSKVSSSQSKQALSLLLPMVLGSLGAAKRKSNLNTSDFSQVLQKNIADEDQKNPVVNQILSAVLDKDKDGSYIDDILEGAGGKLLGKMFG